MSQQPDPVDPERDEDLAWLDRDPMTAEEREAALDRICEEDEPPSWMTTGTTSPSRRRS
jgi:hypothetical protein